MKRNLASKQLSLWLFTERLSNVCRDVKKTSCGDVFALKKTYTRVLKRRYSAEGTLHNKDDGVTNITKHMDQQVTNNFKT